MNMKAINILSFLWKGEVKAMAGKDEAGGPSLWWLCLVVICYYIVNKKKVVISRKYIMIAEIYLFGEREKNDPISFAELWRSTEVGGDFFFLAPFHFIFFTTLFLCMFIVFDDGLSNSRWHSCGEGKGVKALVGPERRSRKCQEKDWVTLDGRPSAGGMRRMAPRRGSCNYRDVDCGLAVTRGMMIDGEV